MSEKPPAVERHTNFDASRGIPSTAGTQLEQDLAEARSILQEAIDTKPTPWIKPWRKRAKEFLAKYA